MRTRPVLASLLAGALFLAACSGDESSDPTATDTPTAGATDGGTDAPTDAASQADLVSEDLPDGVAATVGDTEVAVADLQQRLELIRQIPQVKKQLEGENADQVEAQLESQALGQLVLQEIVLQGAAEEDVQIGDEQVAERRTELAEQAGGEEALAEQLASSGVPEDQLARELRASMAFELVVEQLLTDAGIDPQATPDPASTEAATDPEAQQAQQVQQDWLRELVTSTDVVVDEEYGAWNPSSGQVVPA